MSEPPPLESWYGSNTRSFGQMLARGALLAGVRHLAQSEDYVAYSRLRDAAARVEPAEARRIRGLVHAAAAGVKLTRGDARGAERQLQRARTRLAEGAPTLADVDVKALLRAIEARYDAFRAEARDAS